MLRALVVDDEELPRQRVKDLVMQHAGLQLIGEADNGAVALDMITELEPDVLFLDIQMPELDGFQLVAALDVPVMPAIIFVTAYDAYALRAFEVNAIDYLLKPVSADRFSSAVARVLSRREAPQGVAPDLRSIAERASEERGTLTTRFVARRGSKHYFVRVTDVDWIEAEANYVRLQVGEKSHLIRETMKGLEAKLDATQFVRVHRSVIVAIERIQSIEAREQGEYLITMPGGHRFESSRGYSDRVRALLR